jgi:hypothetical protein
MKNRASKNYLRMSEVYRIFSSPWKQILDFSDEALVDMYQYETHGVSIRDQNKNGFYVGKQWMDVNIKMWREDIQTGILTKHELYSDNTFPRWWLEKILPV